MDILTENILLMETKLLNMWNNTLMVRKKLKVLLLIGKKAVFGINGMKMEITNIQETIKMIKRMGNGSSGTMKGTYL